MRTWWHMPSLDAALKTFDARIGSEWSGSIMAAWLYKRTPAAWNAEIVSPTKLRMKPLR